MPRFANLFANRGFCFSFETRQTNKERRRLRRLSLLVHGRRSDILRLFFFVCKYIELVDPDSFFVDKGIDRTAVFAFVKITFIVQHIAAADEAQPAVNGFIRFKREYRATC